MLRSNSKSARLANHMSRYNRTDARIDHPHSTTRELVEIVREVVTGRKRPYRPLRCPLRAV